MLHIKRPTGPGCGVRFMIRIVVYAVYSNPDGISLPIELVGMEIFGHAFKLNTAAVLVADHVVEGFGMNSSHERIGIVADLFHNVDLPAARPADFFDVFAEHPNGWPCAEAFGKFGAYFEPSSVPFFGVTCYKSSRSVMPFIQAVATNSFHKTVLQDRAMCFDNQFTVFDSTVLA